MAGKKKGNVGHVPIHSMPTASERARNRASPKAVVKLYDHLSNDQKVCIAGMTPSMLDIKCDLLHNPLINWLGPLYDKYTREFVIPGRGRIPLNADSVYRTLGLPRGELPVRYGVDPEIEARLGPIIFPNHSSTPKITEVATILKEMSEYDDRFKQIWIMYLTCTLLCPTTCNKVSNSVYHIMDNFGEVHNMNLCQFVADKLHEELSADSWSSACLFHMQLLYVDSLDVSHLNINLSDGPFVVNRWSKQNVDTALDADLRRDGSGYGFLELKQHLAINLKFFGGAASFEQWVATNSAPNCPRKRQEKVARLVGHFASGLTGLLGNLVQGWTELDEDDDIQMEQSVGDLAEAVGINASSNGAGTSSRLLPLVGNVVASVPSNSTTPAIATKMSDVPIRNVRAEDTINSETHAASKDNSGPSSPVTKSPPVCPTTTIAASVPAVTRSVGKLAKAGFSEGIVDIMPRSSHASKSVKFSSSPLSSHRVTQSATKAAKLADSSERVEIFVVQSAGNSSKESILDYGADRDYLLDDDDDDDTDRFIIQTRDQSVQQKQTEDGPSNSLNVPLAADSAVLSGLVPLAVMNCDVVEENLNTDQIEQAMTGDSHVLGQFAGTSFLHVGAAPFISETEKQNYAITKGNDDQIESHAAVELSSGVHPVDANKVVKGVQVVETIVSHQKAIQPVKVLRKRRLRLVSKEDEPSIAISDIKSCLPEQSTVVSPPKKQWNRVDAAPKITAIRSSPRLSKGRNAASQASADEPPKNNDVIGPPVVVDEITKPSSDDTNVPDGAPMDCLPVNHFSAPASAIPFEHGILAPPNQTGYSINEGVSMLCQESNGVEIIESLAVRTTTRNDGIGDDAHIVYATPAMPPPAEIICVGSNTPRTRLRMARVVLPSKFMLPPFSRIVCNEDQDKLYQQVIKHHSDSEDSKIKDIRFLQIDPTWVYTWDLANSVMPSGQLSTTVAEIGIAVLQQNCPLKKIIFPWIVTVYLLERKFSSNILRKHFRRDTKYQLSHQSLLSFPVFQELGTKEKPCGHWYTLFLNFDIKRFEVLDSARGVDDESLISHASSLVDAIKEMYLINYSESSKQIQNYELEYIDAPKQNNKVDCGFFMLKFLELWNGRVVPAITFDQIPELRKMLTWNWLYHPLNKLKGWKKLLEKNWL